MALIRVQDLLRGRGALGSFLLNELDYQGKLPFKERAQRKVNEVVGLLLILTRNHLLMVKTCRQRKGLPVVRVQSHGNLMVRCQHRFELEHKS